MGGLNQLNLNSPQGGINNSKTPKEAYKRLQGIIGGNNHSTHDRPVEDNRLNLSVDIAGRHSPANIQSQHIGNYGATRNQAQIKKRDGISLRMSRINEGDKLLNNSVHEIKK